MGIRLAFGESGKLVGRCEGASVRLTCDQEGYDDGAVVPCGHWQPLTCEDAECLQAGDATADSARIELIRRPGARPVWFYSLGDRSWACCMFRDGKAARVWQAGPRRLWDETEAAFRWWEGQGRPGLSRFGLTVTARGERVWLDDPANSWTL